MKRRGNNKLSVVRSSARAQNSPASPYTHPLPSAFPLLIVVLVEWMKYLLSYSPVILRFILSECMGRYGRKKRCMG